MNKAYGYLCRIRALHLYELDIVCAVIVEF